MQSSATTVAQYLAELPDDRRTALEALRKVILKNLDRDYEEGMQYGHIGYYVPHRVFPAGYHCDPKQPLPFVAIASQKNNMAMYLMGVYCGCGQAVKGETAEATWFRETWQKTGKKLDMGKACIRFKKIEDVPLEVVGAAIKRIPAKKYIEAYQASNGAPKSRAKTTTSLAAKVATRRPARTTAGK